MSRSDTFGPEVATLGGGCFWTLEALLSEVPGVRLAVSGYSGPAAEVQAYESGMRNELSEVVQVTLDPQVLDYSGLLQHFFTFHNPWLAVAPKYRSVIYYQDARQQAAATTFLRSRDSQGERPLRTLLLPLYRFFPAPEAQQRYYHKDPQRPYCRSIIAPRLAAFRKGDPLA